MNELLKDKIQKLIDDNSSVEFRKIYKDCKLSVSKIVDCFKEPFDAEGQAERCSKKYKNDPSSKYYNMEPWDILEMWNKAKEAGQYSGRCLDDYIGCVLNDLNSEANDLYINQENDKIKAKFNTFKYMYEHEFKNNGFEFLCRELYICDPENKWKGRFDALFGKDNTLILIDWKNNEKITEENSYNNLKGPLYKYCASDLNGYTIQLYLYKYALEKYYGFSNVKTLICRVGENDYQFYRPQIEYSKELVEQIIKYAINQNLINK